MTLLFNQLVDNYPQVKQLDEFMEGHKGYIAGGVFKNIFNGEKIKDVDIFFRSQSDFDEAVSYFRRSERYEEGYSNAKVISFLHKEKGVSVELIKHKFKSPIAMIKEFDFTITKFVYYDSSIEFGFEDADTRNVAFHEKFFEHLHLKRLIIDQDSENIVLPVGTFNRMFRYAEYGYFPNRDTKIKIIEALRELPSFSDEALSQNQGMYLTEELT